ncbi:MAG: hypothetical protein KDD82_01145 [Planctomycetes bacterium]|nr:hypothetical protein [Planctomycetota bacterium]
MNEAKLHALLVDSPTPLVHPERRASVAHVVAQALGVPQAEANQRVRYGGGFLLKGVPATLARRVGRELAGQGVGTFSVPQDQVRRVGRPKRVGYLALEGESLVVAPFLNAEHVQPVPWAEVQALHAHVLCVDPESEEREGLPPRRRGGNVASLSPYTRRLLEAINVYEERERVVLRMGIDLWLRGKLWRLSYDDPGVYTALDLPPLPKSKRSKATFAELSADPAVHLGRYVEWSGRVTAVEEGRLWLAERAGGAPTVRLDAASGAALNARACEPGQRVRYRARVDAVGADGTIELSDGEFKLAPHSLENYVHLVRKVVASVPPEVLVPPSTRAFAQGLMPFQGLVFAKPEELEAFNAWLLLASQNGISFNAEDLGDEFLEDADEAIPVDDSTIRELSEVVDVADDELEESREVDSLKIIYDPDTLEDTRDEEPADVDPLDVEGDSDALEDTRDGISLEESAEGQLKQSMIANTGRLDRVHLDEILKSAGELGDLIDDEPGEADAETEATMKFFDATTGRWTRVDPEADVQEPGGGEPSGPG